MQIYKENKEAMGSPAGPWLSTFGWGYETTSTVPFHKVQKRVETNAFLQNPFGPGLKPTNRWWMAPILLFAYA